MNRLTSIVVTLALLVSTAAFGQTQETVIYYHTDAIGSVRMITDNNGQVIGRYDFSPFGVDVPQTPMPPVDPRQFAGKERDAATTFDYFGARDYQSLTGRFTAIDPVINIEAAMIDPQRWNRYAYVTNRPLSMIDPDGREAGYIYLPSGQMVDPYRGESVFTSNTSTAIAAGVLLLGSGAAAPEVGLMGVAAAARWYPAAFVAATELFNSSSGRGLLQGMIDFVSGVPTSNAGPVVILGSSPGYLDHARALRAHALKVPSSVWNRIGDADKAWEVNKAFLDRMVKKGATFVLSTRGDQAQRGSSFWKELRYLETLGYHLTEDGLRLIRE